MTAPRASSEPDRPGTVRSATRFGVSRFHTGLLALLLVGACLSVLFGWPMPNRQRAYDEKFTLDNARRILVTGELLPATAFHPALSYLPQTLVLAAVEGCRCLRLGTGSSSVLAERSGGRRAGGIPGVETTALGYRVCRLTSALFGLLAILLLARLGRRLSSPGVGLLAAALFAGAPWLIWASGICNEDAGLVLAVLVVAVATLAALERPGIGRFLLAGGAVGLALATKFNAGPLALPLTLASFWRARRDRRYLGWLALAGGSAVAIFLLLDVHYLLAFDTYARDFMVTLRDYERKGRRQGHGFLSVLGLGLASPADGLYLGLAGGALALLGAVWILGRRGGTGEEASPRAWRVLVLFPISYVGVYAAATRNVSPHNWLPVLPFAALFAAEGAARLAAVIRSRLPPRPGAIAAKAALGLLALAGLGRGARFVYLSLVPPTYEQAVEAVAERLEHGATLVHDVPLDRYWVGRRAPRTRLVEHFSAALEDVSAARVEAADALVSTRARSDVERLAGPGAEVFVVESRGFASRGETLTVAIRPWSVVATRGFDLGAPEAARSPLNRRVLRPKRKVRERLVYTGMRAVVAPPDGSHLSLEIPLRGASGAPRCELRTVGGRRHLLVPTRRLPEPGEMGMRARRGTRLKLVSERIAVAQLARLELRCPARAARRFGRRPEMLFWTVR